MSEDDEVSERIIEHKLQLGEWATGKMVGEITVAVLEMLVLWARQSNSSPEFRQSLAKLMREAAEVLERETH